MDETQQFAYSSTKKDEIMDEPLHFAVSSTKMTEIMDEPQHFDYSSTKTAKTMDEPRRQFSPVKSAGSSVKGLSSICRGKLPAPGLRTTA